MRNILLIIGREYLVRVRTKSFIFVTLLMPLLLGCAVVIPNLLMLDGTDVRHIVIVAADGSLANSVKSELAPFHASGEEIPTQTGDGKTDRPRFNVSVETAPTEALRRQLSTRVRDGSLDGFLWIDADAVTTRKGTYYSRNASDIIESSIVSRALRLALSERLLAGQGLSPAQAKEVLGQVNLNTVHIDKQGTRESNGMGAFLLPFLLLMAIYMTVLIYGLYVMRSVLEEKASRVVEVLLSSVTPMQLMAGKIIGVGAVGLTQVSIWAAAGIILGKFTNASHAVGESMKDAHLSVAVIIAFLVFFILGYATYACLYAAIGAMVNSDEEAQQFQFPVTLPLILCIVLATAIMRDPDTTLAFVLSMFPLTSPIIMFVRISVSTPPLWQIAYSIAISLASLYGLVWLTSRIYRVGILMYGKRPTLSEIFKWIHYV